MSFPNLEELSLRIVLALPKAYRISLQPKILSSIPCNLALVRTTLLTVLIEMYLEDLF